MVNKGQRQSQPRNLAVAHLCFEHVKVYVAQSSAHGDIGTPGDQPRNLNPTTTTPKDLIDMMTVTIDLD